MMRRLQSNLRGQWCPSRKLVSADFLNQVGQKFVVHFPSEIPSRTKRLKRNGIEAHYLNTRGRALGRDHGRSRHPPQTPGQIRVPLRTAACRSQRRGGGYEV